MAVVAQQMYRLGIRPHLRRRETGLLLLATVALIVGKASLESFRQADIQIGDAQLLATFLGLTWTIHIAFVITGRRMDEVLYPVAVLLSGISLLLMERLPQDLVVQSLAGREMTLGALQLVWISIGFVILAAIAIFV